MCERLPMKKSGGGVCKDELEENETPTSYLPSLGVCIRRRPGDKMRLQDRSKKLTSEDLVSAATLPLMFADADAHERFVVACYRQLKASLRQALEEIGHEKDLDVSCYPVVSRARLRPAEPSQYATSHRTNCQRAWRT
jgi:hypothetical protein